MKSIVKTQTPKEKDSILLERLCSNLQDRFFITDVALTVDGGGKDPNQQFEGKLVLLKNPVEAKTTAAQD